MSKEIELLSSVQQIVKKRQEKSVELIQSLKKSLKNRSQIVSHSTEDEFNVFSLISNHYYRENFHSDIIRSFLCPRHLHGQGNKFLMLFLNLLNKHGKVEINPNDYESAIVEREQARVDVLIKSSTTNLAGKTKVILIENKINGAIDQDRQLPRYFKTLTDAGFEVEAIVYIPLLFKSPSQNGWELEEISAIEEKLSIFSASNEYDRANLVQDWLIPCIQISSNIDVISTLRQFIKIIQKRKSQFMDKLIMTDFYDEMLKEDNYKTALSINNYLNQLNEFRARRLYETFEYLKGKFKDCDAFPWKGEWRMKFWNSDFDGHQYSMEVVCNHEEYEFVIWEEAATLKATENALGELLKSLDLIKGLQLVDERAYKQKFKFPSEEKEAYDQVELFLRKLNG